MFTKILGLALVVGSMSGTASAGGWERFFDHHQSFRHFDERPTVSAPEIDPASAMSALTMLASGLVILRGRRSKQ
jgi:hypothetical protein